MLTRFLFACALSSGLCVSGHATPIVYTFEDFAPAGDLGSDGLLNITYTITAYADTSQVVVTPNGGGYPIYSVVASLVTVTLVGLEGPGGYNPLEIGYVPISKVLTVTSPAVVVYNSGPGIVGVSTGSIFGAPNIYNMPINNLNEYTWDFVTPIGPNVVDSYFPLGGLDAQTNEGLVLSGDDNSLPTFQASVSSAPEPASEFLLGIGLLLGAMAARRKKRRTKPVSDPPTSAGPSA